MSEAKVSGSRLSRLPTRFAYGLVAALGLCVSAPSMAAVLAGWNVSTITNTQAFGPSPFAATTSDPNVTVGGLTRGSGVTTSGTPAARGWGGTDWTASTAAAATSGGDYFTFTVTATSGHQVSFSSISKFDYRRSAQGATSGVLQYQIGGGAFTDITTLDYSSTSSSGASLGTITLSGVPALQNVPGGTTVTFRVVNFGGLSAGGTWYVFDAANSTASDLEVSGTVGVGGGSTNGVCGTANGGSFSSAPTTNLCATGTPSAVTGSGPWAWSCAGSGGGTTANCSANLQVAGQPFTIFHMNDVHARLTPHKWQINQHGSDPAVFEDVGGAAYLAGKLESLVSGDPTALVLDGGDISEGNPIGDMNCTTPQGGGAPVCQNSGYGNGGMTAFYSLLHSKLAAIGGARGGRGIDALVVGNHDVRDISYIQNMEQMHAAGVPVISVNVRDIATGNPHFAPYTTVTVNGVKIGIIGYTTSSATVGASLASTLTVVDCQWTGSAVCNISDYVNTLRTTEHCDVVILLTHDGHSDLVDPVTPVIADSGSVKVPEIAVTGHWHTWAETVWQPDSLHYKTIFTESSSYMKYIGELHVTAAGGYVSSVQHILRNADITPDADVQALVDGMITQYNNAHPGHPVNETVGWTNDDLELDNRMKWWSADEYPWSGNNSAGQWITDAMKWKCDRISWPSGGGCDLAIEAGGGVRADIPAGPVTYMQVYETFPWADDTYVRVSMTGQDIINFLNATNLDTGFSREMDVSAVDGVISPSSVLMNGQPIGLSTVYKVAINNYMLAHPPSGYVWPTTVNAEADPANELVRDSLSEFMRVAHPTQATAYSVGGSRYHFNGEYSGGYRAVVTMMNDNDTKPTFEDAFIRLLSANDETLARRGGKQVPTSIVNADGSVVASNRLSEQELYRSFLGFKTGALHNGDIIEVWGKASFFGGDPEFVDQEGVYGDGQEFKIVGHDASFAKPSFMQSINAVMTDNNKNHYVKFLAKKAGADTVIDQNGTLLKVWDRTGFASFSLPGTAGTTILEITGVPTSESFGLRFRGDTAVASTATLPGATEVSSHMTALAGSASAPVTLNATAAIVGGGFAFTPVADAQVASGNPNSNSGTTTNLFVQGTTATGTFGIERDWLKFDLSSLPAGSTISSATLELWNWRSNGPSMPTEVRSSATDTWTETGITYANQPALGPVLDTQTLASGVTNHTYSWNVTSFAQNELNGDKTVSLMVKAVDENQAGGPSYAFDAKEFGSNAPILRVTTGANASSVANVAFFYRYSTDNSSWTAWTAAGAPVTTAPYNAGFTFPNGFGYYEFYSVATDNLGHAEPTPVYAQTAVHYQAASGAAQTISFGALPSAPVSSAVALSATATSGLPVSFSSQTNTVCTVSGTQVTTVAIGTCTIAADQPGNVGVWLAASTVTRSFQVTGLSQTITFNPITPVAPGISTTLSATASSTLPVTFSSQTSAVCSVSGTTLTALTTGTCTVAADQAGNSFYSAATTVTQSFTVSTLSQTITFGAIGDRPLNAGAFAVSVSASSGLPVTVMSQTTSVCSVSGTTVTPLTVGTCTLIASQAGNSTYAPAPNVPRSFEVTSTAPSADEDGDAPLPLWAWALLGLAMFAAVQYRQRQNDRRGMRA